MEKKEKRIERLTIEMSILEGKELGIKEFDRKLQKIIEKYRKDLSPQSGNMLNEIVHALHVLRANYTKDINDVVIELHQALKQFEMVVEEEELPEDIRAVIKDIVDKLGGK